MDSTMKHGIFLAVSLPPVLRFKFIIFQIIVALYAIHADGRISLSWCRTRYGSARSKEKLPEGRKPKRASQRRNFLIQLP